MQKLNRTLLDNLVWLLGSLVLAFIVWVFATLQSDPIQQQRFAEAIPIRLTVDAGLLITQPTANNRTARVVVRAPGSILGLLTAEEIRLTGDLTGLGPGEHTIELQASLLRQPGSVVDISPRIIQVTLEESAQRQVALRAVVIGDPPAGYSHDEPSFDLTLNQTLVSGAAGQVNEVVAAQVELDLRQQRNPYEADLRLIPVDAEGNTVVDVTLDPAVVRVSVNIRRRDDVREISVRPTIQGTPPSGYVLNAISYEPQTVLISGSPAQLAALPDTIGTQPIDLTERTSTFDTSVPVILPTNNLLLLAGQTINVSVEISPVTASRQFDNIPIEVLGLPENFSARVAPDEVSVLVTGPQPQIDALTDADVRVALDLNGLQPGNYTLAPSISISGGQIAPSNITILPADIDVEIRADLTITPSLTPTPTG